MNYFLKRYAELGEKFDPEIVLRPSFRVNTNMISKKELIKRLSKNNIKTEKIPFLQAGYFYESSFSLGSTPEYLLGLYYLQEAASQVPPIVLAPKSGELVLDMAASPGSKTTQMSEIMRNQGVIVALDNNIHRADSLVNNIERMGASNVIVYKKDSRYADDFEIMFDKILLDVPCSGNFTDSPDWFYKRSIDGINSRVKIQKDLLAAAYRCLKSGGEMVYSTCTLEPEENEMVINWFLQDFDDMSLLDTGLSVGSPAPTEVFGEKLDPRINLCRRFWPHKTGTQGFFVAKLKKN